MDLYESSLPAVFATAESPLERLLESLLESQFDSLLESRFEGLLESLLERASHREEKSFPREAFGRWKSLSLWNLWLIEGSKSVEALMLTLT
jgi:hypothetical protein